LRAGGAVLTKKGKYGLKAMAHLAQVTPGEFVHVVDIAEQQNIPKRFLNAILFELRSFGFVNSKMGKHGGYTLAREAETITVGEVVRAIDGPLAPIACASKTRYQRCDDCVSESTCPVRFVMVEAQRALSQVLDNCSLARMVQLAHSNEIDALCGAAAASSSLRLAVVKN
jgi:Rrf2 family protein